MKVLVETLRTFLDAQSKTYLKDMLPLLEKRLKGVGKDIDVLQIYKLFWQDEIEVMLRIEDKDISLYIGKYIPDLEKMEWWWKNWWFNQMMMQDNDTKYAIELYELNNKC